MFCNSSLTILSGVPISEVLIEGYIIVDEDSPEELQDIIDYYANNPIDWNTCSIEDIEELPLNYTVRDVILSVKSSGKKYSDWKVFKKDSGLNDYDMEALKTFFDLEQRKGGSGIFYSYISIENKRSGRFHISKNLNRSRWRSAEGISIGFISESDMGEPNIWDHYNFSLQVPIESQNLEMRLGSYRIYWGHGLLFSTSLMGSRSGDALGNLSMKKMRIAEYVGSDENRFLFGSAIRWYYKRLSLMSFYSNHRLDAGIDDGVVVSFRNDGIHRTQSQLRSKDILLQRVLGVTAVLEFERSSLGAIYYRASHSHKIREFGDIKDCAGVSFFHKLEVSDIIITGELAFSKFSEIGLIQNGIWKHDRVSVGFGYRYFSSDFTSLMGSPARKFSGSPSNEKGEYFGLKIRFNSGWWLSSYADFFSRLQIEESSGTIPKGVKILNGMGRRFRNGVEVLASMDRTHFTETSIKKISSKVKVSSPIINRFLSTIRFSHVRLRNDNIRESGLAVGVSLKMSLDNNNSLYLGTVHFHSTSYDSRLYMYEKSVPGRFGVVSLSGTGYRYHIIWNKRISDRFNMNLAGRFQSKYDNISGIWATTKDLEFQMDVVL